MSPSKEDQKSRLSLNLTDVETVEKFKSLKSEKTNPDFIAELLSAYEQLHGKTCSNEPKDYFPNLQGADRKEKEPILKEMFNLEPKDPLLMSECELLEKASQYSGKSIAEMSLEGRLLVAKNEIGRQVQYAQGKGKKGTGDTKIAQTLEFMKQSSQKMSLNRLTQLSGSNRTTVERWCERNNVTFE